MQKTHWKKNNDPRYISGEDLQFGESLNKGLRPVMDVVVIGFEDKETFDQSTQSKAVKTGLWLAEYPSMKRLYKPMILNATNAKLMVQESKSDFMEDWINVPVTLKAVPYRGNTFVARLSKFTGQAQQTKLDDSEALKKINECKDENELKTVYTSLSDELKKLKTVVDATNAMKDKFNPQA